MHLPCFFVGICWCLENRMPFELVRSGEQKRPETVRCVSSHLSLLWVFTWIVHPLYPWQNTYVGTLRHSAFQKGTSQNFQDFVAGRNADEVKKFFLEMGDVYITVEGGPGVAQDARKVMARNASVLALKRTGGIGKGVTLSQGYDPIWVWSKSLTKTCSKLLFLWY